MPQQEIQCVDHPITDKACYPSYSAKQKILELPEVQVTSDIRFPGQGQFKVGACYKATLMQGIKKPSQSIIPPSTVTQSKSFTLIESEEILCK